MHGEAVLELEAGTIVANRYRILRQLGRGGMGEVFAAENLRTGRQVAIKLLRSDSKAKSSAVARFRREARAAGSITSDHVTQVLDVEEDSEHGIALVFELLEGESLIDRLKRTGPLSFDELHPYIEQVWMGLADAHRVGVIHRDLKPSNVFLEARPDGSTRVKILDFGISKLPKEIGGETLTEMGQSLGTFSFMPPEQIGKAKTVDHRADIYACCTLIYQALSGQLPYDARNILAMVDLKNHTDARRLGEVMPGPVDPRLEAFLARGLSRDPEHRFQSALEALDAWRELRPQAVSSRPSSAWSPHGFPAMRLSSNAPGSIRDAPTSPALHPPYGAVAVPPNTSMPRNVHLSPPVAAMGRGMLEQPTPDMADTVIQSPIEPHPAGHTFLDPASTQPEGPPSEGAAPYSSAQPLGWAGPNGTAVLDRATSGLPLPRPTPTARDIPILYESSSGSSSQPTQIYRPSAASPVTPNVPGPAHGETGPLQPPSTTAPSSRLRVIGYVVAALVFAVVSFLLVTFALQALTQRGWLSR